MTLFQSDNYHQGGDMMVNVTLGRTDITVNRNGFGALPVQRVSSEEAVKILRKAYESGSNFFDTARSYSDSEYKIGLALSDVRENIIIATKTPSTTVEGFWGDLEKSLSLLKTDYIDIYQFHNPSICSKPNDGTGLYESMLEAKKQGKIRFIGITNHRLPVAIEAVESRLYDTLQFPFSYLTDKKDEDLVNLCKNLSTASPIPYGRTSVRARPGKDEKDRSLHRMRQLQGSLSLWAGYPKSFKEEL
jgi:aryl-alcohol dehydrogenase-like predicted oxidoreductase